MTDKNRLLTAATADIGVRPTSSGINNDDYGTTSGERATTDEKQDRVAFPSCRHILYLMMFLGFVVAFNLRACLNEAIVAMVNQTAVSEQTVTANVTDDYNVLGTRDFNVAMENSPGIEVNRESCWPPSSTDIF